MTAPLALRLTALALLTATVACGDAAPVAPPVTPGAPSLAAAPSDGSDERVTVSPVLAAMNERLAASGAKVRVAKAELRYAADGWNGVTSTTIIASDRERGFGAEWVKGDPRRDGRRGVTYANASREWLQPPTRDPNGANVRPVSYEQLDAQIEEGVASWRGLACSSAPIERAPVAAGANSTLVDDFFLRRPLRANYRQPADIVQGGWLPRVFFQIIGGGAAGDGIIGVAFTLVFVDDEGNPTDIDRDGNDDTGLSEIFYNSRFFWGTNAARNVVDFYSIITHETGHSLGLNHFGKVFVTKKGLSDGFQLGDIKYAPYAMMNAVYVTGRNELAGTDNSSFCQIWASRR